MARARVLDVSELEPPEPMVRVLAALRELGDDEFLVFRHRREPFPLYPMLTEMGFSYRVRKGEVTPVEVLIWAGEGEEPQADA